MVVLCGIPAAVRAQSYPEVSIRFDARISSTALRALSADGKTIVGCEMNNKEEIQSLVICDAYTGIRLGQYPARSGPAAISPRGDLLIRAEWDPAKQSFGGLVVTDTLTGKVRARLTAAEATTLRMTFAPDGKLLAGACRDNNIRLWNTATGAVHTVFPAILSKNEPDPVFSPDGKIMVAMGANGSVKRWDLIAGKELPEFPASPGDPSGLAFSPDGKILALCSGREVHLLDSTTGQEKATFKHAYRVSCLAFSPDNKMLATGTVKNERDQFEPSFLKVWELATGREVQSIIPDALMIERLQYSVDGDRLFASFVFDNFPRVYDVPALLRWKPPQPRAILAGHEGPVNDFEISPDGTRLATASDDRTVKIWDPQTGRELFTLRGHPARVERACFSPDGHTLLAITREQASPFRDVKLWDARTGNERPPIKLGVPPVDRLLFSPDGKYLAISQYSELRLYDPLTGKLLQNLAIPEHGVSALAFSPDGRTLAVATSRPGPLFDNGADVRTWELASGKERSVISEEPGNGSFGDLRFSPDGKLLAGVQQLGGVTIWDATTWKKKRVLEDARDLRFSPDSKYLIFVVFAWGNSVRQWDLATGKTTDLVVDNDSGLGMQFSPDRRLLVTYFWFERIEHPFAYSRLWDLKTGRKLMTLENQVALRFTPDGKILAALSMKGDAVLYDVEALVGGVKK